jgi:hypothetical protein
VPKIFKLEVASSGGEPKAIAQPPTASEASPKTPQQQQYEKRAMRYHVTCPAKLFERLERAKIQSLYLVECNQISETSCNFVVLG